MSTRSPRIASNVSPKIISNPSPRRISNASFKYKENGCNCSKENEYDSSLISPRTIAKTYKTPQKNVSLNFSTVPPSPRQINVSPAGARPRAAVNKKKPLLIISIDIGKNKQDEIHVYADSKTSELAAKFCQRNGLSSGAEIKIERAIQEQICNNLEKVMSSAYRFEQPGTTEESCLLNQLECKNILIGFSSEKTRNNWKIGDSSFKRGTPAKKDASSKSPAQNHDGSRNNIHEKLYRDGLQERNRRVEVHQAHIEKKEKDELICCTFSPSISPHSREISDQSRWASFPVEDSLILRRKEANSKKEIARRLRSMLEREPCTFKPRLSKISSKIANIMKEDKNPNVFDRLSENRNRSLEREKLKIFLKKNKKTRCEKDQPPESPRFVSVRDLLNKREGAMGN